MRGRKSKSWLVFFVCMSVWVYVHVRGRVWVFWSFSNSYSGKESWTRTLWPVNYYNIASYKLCWETLQSLLCNNWNTLIYRICSIHAMAYAFVFLRSNSNILHVILKTKKVNQVHVNNSVARHCHKTSAFT